jgi:glucose/arabinose dehydrogenase
VELRRLQTVRTLVELKSFLKSQVYSGSMFPKQHRGSLFVAEHGSWRLKRKGDIGHRVGPLPTEHFCAVATSGSAIAPVTPQSSATGLPWTAPTVTTWTYIGIWLTDC